MSNPGAVLAMAPTILFTMAQYILAILRTQLMIVFSWGFHDARAIENGLAFYVQGFKHTGRVEVVYDEGWDLFNVRTLNPDGTIKEQQEGIYLDGLVEKLGEKVSQPFAHSCPGAGTAAFTAALHATSAPIASLGFLRIGEDGRLYFIGKSEHYQASCGHNFPGYELLRNAMEIGITNITHNNTRGHITRLL